MFLHDVLPGQARKMMLGYPQRLLLPQKAAAMGKRRCFAAQTKQKENPDSPKAAQLWRHGREALRPKVWGSVSVIPQRVFPSSKHHLGAADGGRLRAGGSLSVLSSKSSVRWQLIVTSQPPHPSPPHLLLLVRLSCVLPARSKHQRASIMSTPFPSTSSVFLLVSGFHFLPRCLIWFRCFDMVYISEGHIASACPVLRFKVAPAQNVNNHGNSDSYPKM